MKTLLVSAGITLASFSFQANAAEALDKQVANFEALSKKAAPCVKTGEPGSDACQEFLNSFRAANGFEQLETFTANLQNHMATDVQASLRGLEAVQTIGEAMVLLVKASEQ